MKKLALFAAGFIAVIVVALFFANRYLGDIIVKGVEKVGPELTQTSVDLGSVDVQLLAGNAQVKEVVIGNPQGFKAPFAFNLGEIKLDLEPKSLMDEVVVINKIYINSPTLNFEQGKKGSNISKIMDNVNKALAKHKKEGTNKSESEQEGAAKKVIIDDFTLLNAKVAVSTMLTGGKPLEVTVDKIHLTGIGRKEKGVTAAEAASEIINAITRAVSGEVTAGLADIGKLGEQLEGQLDAAQQKLDKVKEDSEKMLKDMKSGNVNPEEAVKGLKGLFQQ